jgi:hypothetical protein
MFSRIERRAAVRVVELPSRRGAESRRFAPRGWWAVTFASLVAMGGCSDSRDLIARISVDAGDMEMCAPSPDNYYVQDMGLDLYFVMERSRDNQFEWSAVAQALMALFHPSDGEFAGMGAGFATYPKRIPPVQTCIDACASVDDCRCLESCGCGDADDTDQGCECDAWRTSCDERHYGPTIEISRVTESPEGFFSALLGSVVGTPSYSDEPAMYPAVLASLRNRAAWEARNPRRRIVQVLVARSLRFPNHDECEDVDDVSHVEQLLWGEGKPKTYVVAVNSDSGDFNSLAQAGGTDAAHRMIYRGNPPLPLTDAFRQLIREIRANEGRCEYLLPPRADLDFKKVNLLAGSGAPLYRKVANRAACAGDKLGWYYDTDENPGMNPGQPKRIIACETACRSLHGPDVGSESGAARIELGCPTVPSGDAGAPSSR